MCLWFQVEIPMMSLAAVIVNIWEAELHSSRQFIVFLTEQREETFPHVCIVDFCYIYLSNVPPPRVRCYHSVVVFCISTDPQSPAAECCCCTALLCVSVLSWRENPV